MAKWLKIFGALFLLYLAIGAILNFVIFASGSVGPYCSSIADDGYPSCEECKFYGSVFGIISLSSCDNILVKFVFYGLVALPNFVFAALAMIPAALMEKSNAVLRWVVAIVLFGISAITAVTALRKRKRGSMGSLGLLSHFSLAIVILYVTYFALSL